MTIMADLTITGRAVVKVSRLALDLQRIVRLFDHTLRPGPCDSSICTRRHVEPEGL
jgi:hypothetical protein